VYIAQTMLILESLYSPLLGLSESDAEERGWERAAALGDESAARRLQRRRAIRAEITAPAGAIRPTTIRFNYGGPFMGLDRIPPLPVNDPREMPRGAYHSASEPSLAAAPPHTIYPEAKPTFEKAKKVRDVRAKVMSVARPRDKILSPGNRPVWKSLGEFRPNPSSYRSVALPATRTQRAIEKLRPQRRKK